MSTDAKDAGNESRSAVLVCGAGASGVEAALDLADSGLKVYLADSSAAIGVKVDDDLRTALTPKLEACANHGNIEILTLSQVEAVSGQPGDFQAKLRRRPRYVDTASCTACGDCSEVCPVSLASPFVGGATRKAIALEHPGAVPNIFNIVKFPGRTACASGCPAGVNVQGFISLLRAGKVAEAYALLKQRCPLPASSGRVCRHRCEDKCRRADIDEESVAIRNLERFVADMADTANTSDLPDSAHPAPVEIPDGEATGRTPRVAIVGGGPAGLTAANDLALRGVKVTIFEAQERLGGMLRYGIP
ncbi:MAG: NAD-binding protein, partial [Acidobacteriota bacterium]|nr:NAD-binding protein [Acidobacteriota bacterium]